MKILFTFALLIGIIFNQAISSISKTSTTIARGQIFSSEDEYDDEEGSEEEQENEEIEEKA